MKYIIYRIGIKKLLYTELLVGHVLNHFRSQLFHENEIVFRRNKIRYIFHELHVKGSVFIVFGSRFTKQTKKHIHNSSLDLLW